MKVPGGPVDQMKETVRRIGSAIQSGSVYLPIRNLAASMATDAKPKDYLGQARNIYNEFLRRWRYVKDPVVRELVTESPRASYNLVMAGDGKGVGRGLGAGDCDCATVALGSLFESIGLPVRVATVANPGTPPGQLMHHVYPEVLIPRVGWVAADPVLYPRGGFGDEPPHSRKVVYSLSGSVVEYSGNLAGQGEATMSNLPTDWERAPMQTFGEYGEEPIEWSEMGLSEFGSKIHTMGCLGGAEPSRK